MSHYPYREIHQVVTHVLDLLAGLQDLTRKVDDAIGVLEGGYQLQAIEIRRLKTDLCGHRADLALAEHSLAGLLDPGSEPTRKK